MNKRYFKLSIMSLLLVFFIGIGQLTWLDQVVQAKETIQPGPVLKNEEQIKKDKEKSNQKAKKMLDKQFHPDKKLTKGMNRSGDVELSRYSVPEIESDGEIRGWDFVDLRGYYKFLEEERWEYDEAVDDIPSTTRALPTSLFEEESDIFTYKTRELAMNSEEFTEIMTEEQEIHKEGKVVYNPSIYGISYFKDEDAPLNVNFTRFGEDGDLKEKEVVPIESEDRDLGWFGVRQSGIPILGGDEETQEVLDINLEVSTLGITSNGEDDFVIYTIFYDMGGNVVNPDGFTGEEWVHTFRSEGHSGEITNVSYSIEVPEAEFPEGNAHSMDIIIAPSLDARKSGAGDAILGINEISVKGEEPHLREDVADITINFMDINGHEVADSLTIDSDYLEEYGYGGYIGETIGFDMPEVENMEYVGMEGSIKMGSHYGGPVYLPARLNVEEYEEDINIFYQPKTPYYVEVEKTGELDEDGEKTPLEGAAFLFQYSDHIRDNWETLEAIPGYENLYETNQFGMAYALLNDAVVHRHL